MLLMQVDPKGTYLHAEAAQMLYVPSFIMSVRCRASATGPNEHLRGLVVSTATPYRGGPGGMVIGGPRSERTRLFISKIPWKPAGSPYLYQI